MSNSVNPGVVFIIIVFLFVMGSMSGWVLELIFRRFFSSNNPERRWINPGFLVGPWIPLYGFGLVIMFLLSLIPYLAIEFRINKIILMIIIMGFSMTLIEYIAGIIFIKGMHVKLWDYSKEWGNIQGIICPLFSAIWTVLGVFYYYLINPHIVKMVVWLSNHIAFSFVIGMFYGVIIVDFCYSINVISKVRAFAKEHDIVVHYEELRSHIRTIAQESKNKVFFLFTFRSEVPLINSLEHYLDEKIDKIRSLADDLKRDE